MWLHAVAMTLGLVLAQADLPNANLPGNSPTLPNSNLLGSLPENNPITLPNTDTSPEANQERAREAAARDRDAHAFEMQQQTLQLAVKASEEAARARAEAAEAKQQLQNALEERQP